MGLCWKQGSLNPSSWFEHKQIIQPELEPPVFHDFEAGPGENSRQLRWIKTMVLLHRHSINYAEPDQDVENSVHGYRWHSDNRLASGA